MWGVVRGIVEEEDNFNFELWSDLPIIVSQWWSQVKEARRPYEREPLQLQCLVRMQVQSSLSIIQRYISWSIWQTTTVPCHHQISSCILHWPCKRDVCFIIFPSLHCPSCGVVAQNWKNWWRYVETTALLEHDSLELDGEAVLLLWWRRASSLSSFSI